MKPRKAFIQVERSRHGRTMYYFRRGNGGRHRLPDSYDSDEFWQSYDTALHLAVEKEPLHFRETQKQRLSKEQKGRALRTVYASLRGAKNRAQRKKMDFELTPEWALQKIAAQKYKCALSGISFYADHGSETAKNLFAPSLDRINAKQGYTIANTRIVILALNIMLMDWGEDVFNAIVNAYKGQRRNKNRKSYPRPKKGRSGFSENSSTKSRGQK